MRNLCLVSKSINFNDSNVGIYILDHQLRASKGKHKNLFLLSASPPRDIITHNFATIVTYLVIFLKIRISKHMSSPMLNNHPPPANSVFPLYKPLKISVFPLYKSLKMHFFHFCIYCALIPCLIIVPYHNHNLPFFTKIS